LKLLIIVPRRRSKQTSFPIQWEYYSWNIALLERWLWSHKVSQDWALCETDLTGDLTHDLFETTGKWELMWIPHWFSSESRFWLNLW
jgi:hypothetical protein